MSEDPGSVETAVNKPTVKMPATTDTDPEGNEDGVAGIKDRMVLDGSEADELRDELERRLKESGQK